MLDIGSWTATVMRGLAGLQYNAHFTTTVRKAVTHAALLHLPLIARNCGSHNATKPQQAPTHEGHTLGCQQ